MYEDGAPYMYDYRNAVISQVEPSTVHARDTVISWYWRRWLLQKAMSLGPGLFPVLSVLLGLCGHSQDG